MPRRTKHYGNCPYCGECGKLTKDHVIPECLFPENEPLPGDLPKIYVCADCNNKKKSGNDEYLRDILATDMHSSKSPIAQEKFSKFGRAVQRNQSKLANDLVRRQLIELRTSSGIIAGFAYTSPEVNRRIMPIIALIVRGLYFYYTGRILSPDTLIEGGRIPSNEALWKIIDAVILIGPGQGIVGDGSVFECIFAPVPGNPDMGVWILNFYRNMRFAIFTGFPKDGEMENVS